jgi:hypothetical protein
LEKGEEMRRTTSWVQSADAGSVTLFLAISVSGLLALVGLAVDGAAKIRAVQRADRVAAQAARVAGQEIDRSSVLAGTGLKVDRRAAVLAAEDFLHASRLEGSAEVSADGRSLRVVARAKEQTIFLGLVGVSEFAVMGEAQVELVTREG